MIDFASNSINYNHLKARVLCWAEKVKLIDEGTLSAQAEKVIEEANELRDALNSGYQIEQIKNELGDIFVTILVYSFIAKYDLLECLESALNKIEKRNGIMIDGKFVKS